MNNFDLGVDGHGQRPAIMRRRALLSMLPCTLAGGVVLAAFSAARAADPVTISIPVVTPLSGATSVIGQDVSKALDIAVRHINEDGGILGRKLELKVVDTQGKPDVMRRELERLARLENAPLILGCEISAATAAAAQFGEQFKLPHLNSAAASAEILERVKDTLCEAETVGNNEIRTSHLRNLG